MKLNAYLRLDRTCLCDLICSIGILRGDDSILFYRRIVISIPRIPAVFKDMQSAEHLSGVFIQQVNTAILVDRHFDACVFKPILKDSDDGPIIVESSDVYQKFADQGVEACLEWKQRFLDLMNG